MSNAEDFFKAQISEYSKKAAQLKKQLLSLSVIRLIVFISTGVAAYYAFHVWQLATFLSILGVVIFLFLLSKYTDLKAKKRFYERLVNINIEELNIAEGNYKNRPDGSEYQDAQHFYSLDIDLFGKGSFYQFLNRTTLKEGSQTLVNTLLSNIIDDVEKRQDAIKELALKPKWYQSYSATARGIHVEYPAKNIIEWLNSYQPFLNKFFGVLPLVFSIFSIVIIALSIFGTLPIDTIGYWLLFGLGITGIYLKKVNILTQQTEKVKDTFRQYAMLLDHIENETWSSKLLKDQQKKIESDQEKSSKIFSKFSNRLDALDNRNNLFSAILANGFLLWDLGQAYAIERWINTYAHKVEEWFNAVIFFDAYNSLGNFAFIHNDYCYPEIVPKGNVIDAKELGHPLLDVSKRITSDLTIKNEQFFIVTGANMAGKSTFLRTVSLHIVMANMGLPVCASKSVYSPVKLITSMRTTDSLDDDSSYFFSELTRLKFMVDQLNSDKNYFVILDEILKGTNSEDKAKGSQKFVKRLTALGATGIIATHDLSLTALENELKAIKNYFFDAEIKNDELYFDYKLKQGVCQNMNASFLLRKMGVV